MAHNILIIGGDGDLALRKLYPALFALEMAGQLDGVESITGLSRASGDKASLCSKMLPKLEGLDGFNDDAWQRFQARIDCLQGDAQESATLTHYQGRLTNSCASLIVYLAVPPKVFGL